MFVVILLLTAVASVSASALQCPPDICWRTLCAVPSPCPNGNIVKHAGFCGCCPACIPTLKIGDFCGHSFLLGSIKGQCPTGSFCDSKTSLCAAVVKV